MKLYNTPKQKDWEINSDRYTAIINGTGFNRCDVIIAKEVIDMTTTPVTIVETSVTNMTQGTVLPALPTLGTEIVPYATDDRIVLGSEILTVSTTAVPLAAIPAGATVAEIEVWDGDIVLNVDGTAPTTTGDGYRQTNTDKFELESGQEIANFQAIRSGVVDANLKVTYFGTCQSDMNE